MAVSINSDVTIPGAQLCEALGVQNPGVGPFYVEAASNGKAQITLGASKAQAGLTFNACHLIVAGKMSEMSKAVASANFKDALAKLSKEQPKTVAVDDPYEDYNSSDFAVDISGIKDGSLSVTDAKPYVMSQLSINPKKTVTAIKLLRTLSTLSLSEAKTFVDMWKLELPHAIDITAPLFSDAEEFHTVTPKLSKAKTKLSTASSLGQPVKGTGGDSTYHCIAISPRVKVAVRIRPNMQVSIRAEGANGTDIPEILREYMNEAGWAESTSGHFSLHLDCKSKTMMRKTIGALLISIGEEFTVIGSQFDYLIGVGH